MNGILAYLLMNPLRNLGIALATSVVSFYNFVVLFVIYKKKLIRAFPDGEAKITRHSSRASSSC
jgi:peptidoglycan biosynthesis protein MviN/MurJ (putative lipid II flippase)